MARPSSAGVIPAGLSDSDQSWKGGALCHGQVTCGCKMSVAWTIASHEKFRIGDSVYKGEELIELAKQICSRCPVQWDCAEFAVDTEQGWGTWAMDIDDLRWLQRHPGRIIERARYRGEPVQIAVAAARRSHLLGCSA